MSMPLPFPLESPWMSTMKRMIPDAAATTGADPPVATMSIRSTGLWLW